MAGRVGPAGLNFFAATEGHTIGVYSVRPLPRMVWRSDLPDWKHQNKSKVIRDTDASDRESMDLILSECLNAANEMTRPGGFAPAQCVLSRLPRNLATMGEEDECLDVYAWQAHADGPRTFGAQTRCRAKEREAFVRWDCGERVRRADLRKAALVVGSYQVGDVVSYCREARSGEHGLQWSVGSRLIGFEKDRNSLGEAQPRNCWAICDSVPVCVAADRLRPCTSPELFGFPLHANQKFFTSCDGRSHTTRLRRCGETQEPLKRSPKQARTAKKGDEALQDVSFLFQKGHCEHQRNGVIPERMAGLRKKQQEESAEEGGRRKKSSLPVLHARCASCPHRDETHRMEQVDEVQCRCYFDGRRSATTHRSRLRDLSDEMG